MIVVTKIEDGGWCQGYRDPDGTQLPDGEFDDIMLVFGRFPGHLVQRFGMDF